MPLLELQNLSKSFEGPAVQGVSLELEAGDILCLLGPSGCGKSTLLRMVAGLEVPDGGRVLFESRDLARIPPQKRNFGLMFQEFALFPHKSVFDNVAFGLHMQKLPAAEISGRVEKILSLMGIAALAGRNVANLSGGERQRVALARSLSPEPRLLMLDEPLGSLDRALRERLLGEIRSILKKLHITAIFVTHDQGEALAVSDRIAVMNAGRLEQVSRPEHLYLQPQTEFVARFLGFRNFLPGRINEQGEVVTSLGGFRPAGDGLPIGKQVILVLRPEAASLAAPESSASGLPGIEGRITRRRFAGRSYHIRLVTQAGHELAFELSNQNPPPMKGENISLAINPAGLAVLQKPGGEPR